MASVAIAGMMTISTTRMKELMIEQKKEALDPAIYAQGFGYTFWIMTFVAIAGGLLGLLLTKPKNAPAGEESTEPQMIINH